jgi:hypothetical protein
MNCLYQMNEKKRKGEFEKWWRLPIWFGPDAKICPPDIRHRDRAGPLRKIKGAVARGAAKRRMRESCSEEGTVIAAPSPNVRGFSCRRISPTVHDHCFHQIARMCEPKTTRTVGSHFAGGADRSTYSLKGG